MLTKGFKRLGVRYLISDTGYGLITITASRFGKKIGELEFNTGTNTIDMLGIDSPTNYNCGYGTGMLEHLVSYLAADPDRTWETIYVIPIPTDCHNVDKDALIRIYTSMGFVLSDKRYDGRNDRYSLALNR